jgi:hypothetical protein
MAQDQLLAVSFGAAWAMGNVVSDGEGTSQCDTSAFAHFVHGDAEGDAGRVTEDAFCSR